MANEQLKNLQSCLECPVCWTLYDNEEADMRPMDLGCGHTTCVACLGHMKLAARELGHMPSCPKCRAMIHDVHPNWDLLCVLEHLKSGRSPLGHRTSASFAYQHARSRGSSVASISSVPMTIPRRPSSQQEPEGVETVADHTAQASMSSPPPGPVQSTMRQSSNTRNRSLSPLGSINLSSRGDGTVHGGDGFPRTGSVSPPSPFSQHSFAAEAQSSSAEQPTFALLLPVRATSIRISTPVPMSELMSDDLASPRLSGERVPRVVRGDSMSDTGRWSRLGSGVNLPPIEIAEALLQIPTPRPAWQHVGARLATPVRFAHTLGVVGVAAVRNVCTSALRLAARRLPPNTTNSESGDPGVPRTDPSFGSMLFDLPVPSHATDAAPTLQGFVDADEAGGEAVREGEGLALHAMRSGGVRGTAQEPAHYRLAASSCEVPHMVEDCQYAVITATGFLSTSEVLLRGCNNVELRVVDCRICAFDVRGCRSLHIIMQDSLCTSIRVVGCCDVHIEITNNVGCSLVAACNRGHMEVRENGNVMGNVVALPPTPSVRTRGARVDTAPAQ